MDLKREGKYDQAHVRDVAIPIHCGSGEQSLKWLASVAIARWDTKDTRGFLTLGTPKSIKDEDQQELDMSATIRDVLQNRQHVFIEGSRDLLKVSQ